MRSYDKKHPWWTSGKLARIETRSLENNMRRAREVAGLPGLSLKTFRKDFAFRARQAGAARDDLNLYQGRDEGILEHHYTNDEWFIVHQCRPWIERMFEQPDFSEGLNSIQQKSSAKVCILPIG